MTISFTLPAEIEKLIRDGGEEPITALKEAALVELYRLRRITHHQLGGALGVSRLETDAILKRHDVPLDLSPEELRAELESLREDLGR